MTGDPRPSAAELFERPVAPLEQLAGDADVVARATCVPRVVAE